jgi:hypothetical protein
MRTLASRSPAHASAGTSSASVGQAAAQGMSEHMMQAVRSKDRDLLLDAAAHHLGKYTSARETSGRITQHCT